MDLKAEKPAKGIMKTFDGQNYKQYHVECNCGNPDDAIDFTISTIDDEIIVETHTLQKTSWWDDPFKIHKSFNIKNEFLYQINYYVRGFLNAITHKLSITWSVWTKGYVKYSQTTFMTAQQALNYAEALKQAVKQVEQNKK